MPIHFTKDENENYFITKFVGQVTDSEMIDAYKGFIESDDWNSQLDELVDLSELNAIDITSNGLERLGSYFSFSLKKREASPIVSIYAPSHLSYGLSRMYTVIAENYATLRVFRDRQEAKAWLEETTGRSLDFKR